MSAEVHVWPELAQLLTPLSLQSPIRHEHIYQMPTETALVLIRELCTQVRCPVCSSLMDQPVQTACRHLFCLRCLLDCGLMSAEAAPPDDEEPYFVSCPLCRTKSCAPAAEVDDRYRQAQAILQLLPELMRVHDPGAYTQYLIEVGEQKSQARLSGLEQPLLLFHNSLFRRLYLLRDGDTRPSESSDDDWASSSDELNQTVLPDEVFELSLHPEPVPERRCQVRLSGMVPSPGYRFSPFPVPHQQPCLRQLRHLSEFEANRQPRVQLAIDYMRAIRSWCNYSMSMRDRRDRVVTEFGARLRYFPPETRAQAWQAFCRLCRLHSHRLAICYTRMHMLLQLTLVVGHCDDDARLNALAACFPIFYGLLLQHSFDPVLLFTGFSLPQFTGLHLSHLMRQCTSEGVDCPSTDDVVPGSVELEKELLQCIFYHPKLKSLMKRIAEQCIDDESLRSRREGWKQTTVDVFLSAVSDGPSVPDYEPPPSVRMNQTAGFGRSLPRTLHTVDTIFSRRDSTLGVVAVDRNPFEPDSALLRLLLPSLFQMAAASEVFGDRMRQMRPRRGESDMLSDLVDGGSQEGELVKAVLTDDMLFDFLDVHTEESEARALFSEAIHLVDHHLLRSVVGFGNDDEDAAPNRFVRIRNIRPFGNEDECVGGRRRLCAGAFLLSALAIESLSHHHRQAEEHRRLPQMCNFDQSDWTTVHFQCYRRLRAVGVRSLIMSDVQGFQNARRVQSSRRARDFVKRHHRAFSGDLSEEIACEFVCPECIRKQMVDKLALMPGYVGERHKMALAHVMTLTVLHKALRFNLLD